MCGGGGGGGEDTYLVRTGYYSARSNYCLVHMNRVLELLFSTECRQYRFAHNTVWFDTRSTVYILIKDIFLTTG